MQIILWLLKYEELLVFFVFYHFKLITLTFWGCYSDKTRHINVSNWTQEMAKGFTLFSDI